MVVGGSRPVHPSSPSPQLCLPCHHISLGDPLLTPASPRCACMGAFQSGLAGATLWALKGVALGFLGHTPNSGAPGTRSNVGSF